jgi:hypothetical protein
LAWASRPNLSGREFAVVFFPPGKDAVSNFEVFQADGLTFFGVRSLVIDDDYSFALATAHLNLVSVNGENFATREIACHRPATARAHAASRSTAILEPLELFLRNAENPHGCDLLIAVGSASHKNVVTDLQVLQLEFLRLLLPLLPLAEMGLIVDHYRLHGPIRFLDLETINSHRSDGSHH